MCAMLGIAQARAAQRYGSILLAAVFFVFLFRDERALNNFEDRMDGIVAQLPPGQRVVSPIIDPGLRVNALAPGFILTPMVGRHFTEPDGTIDEERKELTVAPIRDATPLRRIGAPEDVALAILYLASDASSFMTGQILRPNGGVAMP